LVGIGQGLGADGRHRNGDVEETFAFFLCGDDDFLEDGSAVVSRACVRWCEDDGANAKYEN
jgi:hypothetical protein